MTTPGQATDKATTDAIEAAINAAAAAIYEFDVAHWLCARMDGPSDGQRGEAAAAVRAVAPILMQAGRDQAYAGAHTAYAVKAAPGVPRNPLTWATEEEARQYASLPGDRVVRLLTIVKAEAVPDSHNTQEDA